jgi:hypothetical protein
LPSAPWQIPADALDSEAVVIGVRQIVARRPRNIAVLQEEKTLQASRLLTGGMRNETRFAT